jgi:hypothetical protein
VSETSHISLTYIKKIMVLVLILEEHCIV